MPDPTTPGAPVFESAVVTTYAPNSSAVITLCDESATTKTLVRSDRPQFGVAFGASTMHGNTLVAGSRPGEWLLLGSAAAVKAAEAMVDSSGFTSVIPYTHGRSQFRLTGSLVCSLLEKVCGLDWSDAMTPDGAVVSASVALTTCDIIRNDVSTGSGNDGVVPVTATAGGCRSYVLLCDRSFGQYLFDALLDAGSEFGITVA